GGAGAFQLVASSRGGGYLGAIFAWPFFTLTGFWAALVLLIALMAIGLLVTFDVSLNALLPGRGEEEEKPVRKVSVDVAPIKINGMAKSGFTTEKVQERNRALDNEKLKEKPVPAREPVEPVIAEASDKEIDLDAIVLDDRKDWKLPPFDLLED